MQLDHELKSHFINLYLIALSDNNFDLKELEMIFRIGEEKGISKEEFESILINPTGIQFKYPEDFIAKITLLYDFTRVIWADEKVSEEELEAFLQYCQKLGFEKGESKELFAWLLDLAKNNISYSGLEREIQKLTS